MNITKTHQLLSNVFSLYGFMFLTFPYGQDHMHGPGVNKSCNKT